MVIGFFVSSRFGFRVFSSRHRQMGIGSDPIDSIFFGDEFSKVVHGTIRPYYLDAPNLALRTLAIKL
jgi:hypothetical protein